MYGVKVWGFRSDFLRTRQHPLNFTCLGHQASRAPWYTTRHKSNTTSLKIAQVARYCVGMVTWSRKCFRRIRPTSKV